MRWVLLGMHRSEGGDRIYRVHLVKHVVDVAYAWRRRWTVVALWRDTCGGEGDAWVSRGCMEGLESTQGLREDSFPCVLMCGEAVFGGGKKKRRPAVG